MSTPYQNPPQTPRNTTTPKPGAKRRQRRLPPEVLTHDEVMRLIDACPDNRAAGKRNRALLTVLYRTGLRINEALALRPKDLDPVSGSIRVLYAKGGRARTVGMDARGFEVVGQWLEARGALGLDDRSPLLCMADGTPLTDSYMRVLLPRLARRAGIAKRVHAHGLRHTHAAQLRAEGIEIGLISRQLGHRSIATTARYLDHIAPLDVINAMRKREW